VQIGISNWAYADYNLAGMYWQYCDPYVVGIPYTYASSNYQGYGASFQLGNPYGPPHSQSSNWWSCKLDGVAMACTAGQDAYG
jgi:hypothetical protein